LCCADFFRLSADVRYRRKPKQRECQAAKRWTGAGATLLKGPVGMVNSAAHFFGLVEWTAQLAVGICSRCADGCNLISYNLII
jgi:hypothetical protein